MATILIVDDHAINRQFLLTLLGYSGHRLLEAAEGATALGLARAERPHLVITDILMPNMDGYELVTHMRADATLAAVPVIFYTASYREREARSMAQACGVQWVLSKPADPEAILRVVDEALGTPHVASARPAPLLSASLEADTFSAIDKQLRTSLSALDAADSSRRSDTANLADLDRRRDNLDEIATSLAGSLGTLQAVSSRLTRLVELGLDLAAERDPARMIEILCRAGHGICGAKYAAAAVLDHDSAKLRYCFTRGIESEVLAQLQNLPPNAGVLGRLVRDRVPLRIRTVDGNPEELGLPPSHPPVHAFLGVPLSSKERTYGWLYLVDKIGAVEFTDVDEQLAATIATQLAAAYENLILYDEVNQHRAQLQLEVLERKHAQETLRRTLRARTVMAQCDRVLVHAEDEMTLLNEMCQTIVDAGDFPMVWIGYADETTESTIKLVAQAGVVPAYQTRTGGNPSDDRRYGSRKSAFSQGFLSSVAESRTVKAFENWQKLAESQGYRSALSLPLTEGSTIFGALTLYENEASAFRQEQIELLEELAADIAYGAISLRNRRARELAERNLVEAQEKLTGILNSIDNIVWSLSDHEILYISPVAEKVYGYPIEHFYQNKNLMLEVVHPDDQAHITNSIVTLHEKGAVTREYRILRADGEIRWLEDRTKAVRDADGNVLRFDGVASDITERKQYEAQIEYLATHDPLTNLANRNLLRDRLAQAIASSRRGAHLLALLFVDLDRFKGINDSFGHDVGDALLVAVASRLRNAVREGDTVARPGGDEFIVLLTDIHDPVAVTGVAHQLLMAFAVPFVIKDIELHMTASIGVSIYPNDGADSETLLRNTDTAMYRSKEQGGNSFQFYSSDMSLRAIERIELENALHRAIERNEFELHYQPTVLLKNGEIVGAEALIRWHHPKQGTLYPDHFIPLAEETGLINTIGDWVLKAVCAQNKAWQDAGLRSIPISINLSARQFRHEDIVKSVAAALADVGLEPKFLELELTESLVMDSAEEFILKLNDLKTLGVLLSIDDFGTGYSSLNYLKRFPLDRLKIDRSFILDVMANEDDAAITRSIISLGKCLNLTVLAEGVETREQLAFLIENGCDEAQGTHCSAAVPAAQFAVLLETARKLIE